MKRRIPAALFATALILTISAFSLQSIINWKIDSEKAMVTFTIAAHGQNVEGNFKGAKGEVKFDESDLSGSSITCSIDIATINTGIGGRDKHLQSKDFFAASDFPQGSFVSSKIEKANDSYTVTGNFTLKGVTKVVSFPIKFDGKGDSGNFKGSFQIKRSEYNIGQPDDEIADEVTVNFNIPVTR